MCLARGIQITRAAHSILVLDCDSKRKREDYSKVWSMIHSMYCRQESERGGFNFYNLGSMVFHFFARRLLWTWKGPPERAIGLSSIIFRCTHNFTSINLQSQHYTNVSSKSAMHFKCTFIIIVANVINTHHCRTLLSRLADQLKHTLYMAVLFYERWLRCQE